MEEVYELQYITNLNPSVIFLTIILSILILSLKPRFLPIPFLIGVFFITGGQYLVIGDMFFYVSRIFIFIVIIRLIFRNEWHLFGKFNSIDKLTIVFTIILLLQGFIQEKNFTVIITRIGKTLDTMGMYFIIRIYLNAVEDIAFTVKIFIIMMIPIAVFMLYEKVTAINLFSVLGGVPQFAYTRAGQIRAQGPFPHPIIAGTIAASQIPLFFGLLKYSNTKKIICYFGIIAAIIIVICSASSGPIMTFALSLIGVMSWKLRNNMKSVKVAIIFGIILMEIFMKAHFWYILAKIDIVGGSTGFFRAELITSSLMHLKEWWLFGTNFTAHWMPTGVPWSPNHTDLTNMYISKGVQGGLPLLIIFIAMLVKSFRAVGNYVHNNTENDTNQNESFFVWTIGAVFFSHVITFFTISYFGQMYTIFYFNLAFSSIILSINNIVDSKERINGSM